jgi:glycosyltransferase involved in cell wall biosynthesis
VISVFIPAFNEAANLAATVETVTAAATQAGCAGLQIIIVNDGSRDATGAIAADFAARMPNVTVIEHATNQGLGAGFRAALAIATCDRFLIVPGDNDIAPDLLCALFQNAYRADMVLSYFVNKEARGVARNVISLIFGAIYMITFGIFVQYINGPCVYPTDRLRRLDLRANRFSIVVEATIKLLCSGATYYEVAGYMQKGLAGSTSLSLRNLAEVIRSYLRLVYEIKFSRRKEFAKRPCRVM